MKTIPEPNHEISIVDEVDVLVVGGGPAGIGAALSAARLGARTLIVEQFNCLGGVATSGGHNHFSLFTSWSLHDERIVGGVAEDMRRRMLDGGYATYSGGCLDFHVEGMKLLFDRMTAEAGVRVPLLDSVRGDGAGTDRQPARCRSVHLDRPRGPRIDADHVDMYGLGRSGRHSGDALAARRGRSARAGCELAAGAVAGAGCSS